MANCSLQKESEDTSGLESQAVPENMPGAPPPQSPVHPGAYSTHTGQGACATKARALLNNAAGCLDGLFEPRTEKGPIQPRSPHSPMPIPSLGSSVHKAQEPELRPGERGGGKKKAAPIIGPGIGEEEIRGSLGF